MEAYPNLKPWKPGQSGNLNGRPVGSRSSFSAGSTRDLAEVWAETRCSTPEKQPAVFFATCARIIGPEVKPTIEQNYAGLIPNELVLLKEVMAAINEGLPNAANRPTWRSLRA